MKRAINTKVRLTAALMIAWGAALHAGCTTGDQKAPQSGARENAAKPFIFLYQTPAFTGPNTPRVSGVLAAVWDDGTIVRSASEAAVGKEYIRGRLTPDQIGALRQFVTDSGLHLQKPGGNVAVDAASVDLTLRIYGAARTWAHSPPHTLNPKIEAIQDYVFAIKVTAPESVDAAPYSGYPHAWYK